MNSEEGGGASDGWWHSQRQTDSYWGSQKELYILSGFTVTSAKKSGKSLEGSAGSSNPGEKGPQAGAEGF